MRPLTLQTFICIALAVAFSMTSSLAFAQDGDEGADPTPGTTQSSDAKSESELTSDDRKRYDEHLRSGKAAYADQDFETAMEELNNAYSIFNKPSILFNMALISEKQGELERASSLYQQFLDARGVSLEHRKRASERLAAVEEIIQTSESVDEARKKQQMTDLLPALEAMGIESEASETAMTDETPDTARDENTTESKQSEAKADAEIEDDASIEPERPEVAYTWPVYASFGAAVAALAGGIVMVGLTNDAIDEGKAFGQAGDTRGLESKEDMASTYASTAAGLFVGGAVMAVVGSYFVIRNSMIAEQDVSATSSGDSSPSASVSFSFDKNFLGPVFTMDF